MLLLCIIVLSYSRNKKVRPSPEWWCSFLMCQFRFLYCITIRPYLNLAIVADDADCDLLWYSCIMHGCIIQPEAYPWMMSNRTVRSVVSTIIVIIKELFWFNYYTMLTTAGRNRSRIHLYIVSIACQTGFSIILPLVPFVNEVLNTTSLQYSLTFSGYYLSMILSFSFWCVLPPGSIIFGALSDRIGRRMAIVVSLFGLTLGEKHTLKLRRRIDCLLHYIQRLCFYCCSHGYWLNG